jgi:hypothetical protein
MGLFLKIFGKITGLSKKVNWSYGKKIVVTGPEFFGTYHIYVDVIGNTAVFIPLPDGTLQIFSGDIADARRSIKFNKKRKKVSSDALPDRHFIWVIHPKEFEFKCKDFGPRHFCGKVISSEIFLEAITDDWIDAQALKYFQLLGK